MERNYSGNIRILKLWITVLLFVWLASHTAAIARLPLNSIRMPSLTKVFYKQEGVFRNNSELGTQGPCGENMIFVRFASNPLAATCVCRSRSDTPYVLHRPETEQERCYGLFTQGPCDNDQWIQFVNNKPTCILNPCLEEFPISETKTVLYSGKCVLLTSPCGENGNNIIYIKKTPESYTVECGPRGDAHVYQPVNRALKCNWYEYSEKDRCIEALRVPLTD